MPDTNKGENNKHVSFLEKQYKLYKKRYKLDKNNTGCVAKVQKVQKVQGKNKLSLGNGPRIGRE